MNYLNTFKADFNKLVSDVRANFSWYDKIINDSEYDKETSPYQLPYITGSLLNKYYYNSDFSNLKNSHLYLTSGTSTGKRKKVIYSSQEHSNYINHRKEIFARFISSDCQSACSDLGTGHAADSASEIFHKLGLQSFHIDYRKPIDEHIDLLNTYQPDIIFTMPVIISNIISTGKINFSPKKLIVVGDVASKAWKKNVVNYFGLGGKDLLDIIGSIEVGSIAYECSDCGSYHFDNHIIPEIAKVSDLYKDLKFKDNRDILVLTSTSRNYFPAIRFVTNDLIEGFEMCECNGKIKFSFERITGRIGSELKHGEKISLYDISEAINTYLSDAKFDVYKDEKSFIIKVFSSCLNFDIGQKIIAHIKKSNPDINDMINSGLLKDIQIISVNDNEITSNVKRRFIN